MTERTIAVDDAHDFTFKVRKIVERIENSVPQPPLPRRRTHAIEKQRIPALRRCNIKVVVPRINLQPRQAAFIQLLKQRPEPVRMLVVNGDGLFEPIPVPIRFRAHETSRIPFESLSSQSESATGSAHVLLTCGILEFQCHLVFINGFLLPYSAYRTWRAF